MPEAHHKKTVLITGGTGGIGYALACLFAEHGHDLALVSRSREHLKSAAEGIRKKFSVSVHTFPHDLARATAPEEVYRDVKATGLTINALVNNAGFAYFGSFATAEVDRDLDMIQVNVTALMHLTKLFLNDMVARREGGIMNVASTAAFQPGPFMAVYYASKAFVLSFSEALRYELKDHGVTVTALCPGATRTNFQKRAGVEDSILFSKRLSVAMSAEAVARAGFRGFMRGEAIVIPGLVHKISVVVGRLLPRTLILPIVRMLHERN